MTGIEPALSADDGLAPREPIDLVVSAAATSVPAKAVRDAALVVLNAPPRTYAKVRLDPRSRATLAGCLGALDDDVRAVCWVAGVEMVRDGLMPVAELAAWVDAFASSEPDPEVRALLGAAVERWPRSQPRGVAYSRALPEGEGSRRTVAPVLGQICQR